jgi:hypothetical protein
VTVKRYPNYVMDFHHRSGEVKAFEMAAWVSLSRFLSLKRRLQNAMWPAPIATESAAISVRETEKRQRIRPGG